MATPQNAGASVPVDILLRLAQGNANLRAYTEAVAAGAQPKRWLQRFFDELEVVFVIYRDSAEPGGVGMLLGKGRELLAEVAASGKNRRVKTGSIVLQDLTTAWIAGVVHGDMRLPGDPALRRTERLS